MALLARGAAVRVSGASLVACVPALSSGPASSSQCPSVARHTAFTGARVAGSRGSNVLTPLAQRQAVPVQTRSSSRLVVQANKVNVDTELELSNFAVNL